MKPGRPTGAVSRSRWQSFYGVVGQIPAGFVATYGQVAELAGFPGNARQVGFALAALPEESGLPWQRVINARGEVSPRHEPGRDGYQRHLLEEEGILFGPGGRIDLARFGWEPGKVRLRPAPKRPAAKGRARGRAGGRAPR